MRILIALFMVALPVASAAADQYTIVPYGTSKPEGSQLETIWRAMVINESRPALAYCQAVTKKNCQWFGGVPQMQSTQADRWFTARWSDRAAWHLKQPVRDRGCSSVVGH